MASRTAAARTTPVAGRPLRVALAGCGDVSSVHLDAIAAHPDACLVAVIDPDQPNAEATAVKYDTTGYTDLARALAVARPDIVHICTPHFLHAAMAIGCLEQGVHVLLEKPLAATMADGAAIVQAAQRSPATLGVCLQNRYNTTSQVLRRLLDCGDLGAVLGGRAALTWSRT